MSTKVLVTDGRAISALAIARSLGSSGIEVHVCDDFGRNLSAFSKHVTACKVHDPIGDCPDTFVEWLIDCCRDEQYDLVVPVRDETITAVAAHREAVSAVTGLFVADCSVIERLRDKGACMKAAAEHGVPTPRTYYPAETGIEQIADRASFPVVVKPRFGSGARGIVKVSRPDQLARQYERVASDHADPIIQEFVDHSGGHYSIGTVFDRASEPVATHVYRETKQYPASGGPAIAAQTIEREPWVDSVLELLRAEGWQGPAHMDVLFDPDSGTYKLLEVNPRFWSSLALTIHSGVDIPSIIHQLVVEGTTPTPGEQYAVGTNYRWTVPNELLWLLGGETLTRLRRLAQPTDEPVCHAILARSDPTATVGALVQSIDHLLDSEKRNAVFDRGW